MNLRVNGKMTKRCQSKLFFEIAVSIVKNEITFPLERRELVTNLRFG